MALEAMQMCVCTYAYVLCSNLNINPVTLFTQSYKGDIFFAINLAYCAIVWSFVNHSKRERLQKTNTGVCGNRRKPERERSRCSSSSDILPHDTALSDFDVHFN